MPRPRRTMRRALAFDTFQQVLAEIAEARKAHRTTGNWTLAQICKHLADSVNGSIDGFDLRQHRIKRTLFKRPLLWYTFRWGIPREYTVDPALTPPREIDIEAALTELTSAIERYTAHNGPLQAHPLFGKMPRATWDRVHLFHCAHHLSFVIPDGDRAPEETS